MRNAEQRVHAHPVVVIFEAETLLGVIAYHPRGQSTVEKAATDEIVLDEVQLAGIARAVQDVGAFRGLVSRAEIRIQRGSAMLVDQLLVGVDHLNIGMRFKKSNELSQHAGMHAIVIRNPGEELPPRLCKT